MRLFGSRKYGKTEEMMQEAQAYADLGHNVHIETPGGYFLLQPRNEAVDTVLSGIEFATALSKDTR